MVARALSIAARLKSSTGRPSTRVKLSNALRFANTPTPCFVVLFVYARDGGHQGTYVLHFWRDQAGRSETRAGRDVAGTVEVEDRGRAHRRLTQRTGRAVGVANQIST